MRGISFAYTVPPLVSYDAPKTATWRDWDTDYANSFRPGEVCAAYDRSPRVGGRKIGEVRIKRVTHMSSIDLPDSFYITEGMKWIYDHPECVPRTWHGGKPCSRANFTREAFDAWRAENHLGYLVEFELLKVFAGVRRDYSPMGR